MSHQYYLHFTLGPVQGFVSQARRTRDFWAGSFLLSWLTAKAMAAVQKEAGTIVMPSIDADALLVRLKTSEGAGPKIGSLPNNFIAQVPESFDGNIAVNAVQDAWKALADAVWEHDGLEDSSRALWDQQITRFWDMAWVIADSDDAGVLAMRKNRRSYMPPESLGDKCTMMGEWQELSGAEKPNAKQQKEFWQKVKPFGTMDLRDNERLCAIAYVKRRFVHVWEEVQIDGEKCNQGWELSTSVPSTSYMAAVHWLEALIQAQPNDSQVQTFMKLAGLGEKLTRIKSLSEVLKDAPRYVQSLADIDGRALFDSDKKEAKAINDARKSMLKTVPDFDVPLSPFYAILMMDGDNLGETKRAMGDATALSVALGEFTQQVPDIVEEYNGFLIYAGGDDVLAILPLEDALPCAEAVRLAYMSVFANKRLDAGTYSISAAIEYAHMKLPLTMILNDAHKLLDDVAKDATGRDAVACRVWKPGGEQQTWAVPWDISEDAKATDMLDLVHEMEQRAEKKSDVGYSSKLLYSFRETLNAVMPDALPEQDKDIQKLAKNIKALQLDKLLETTYLSSGLLDGWDEKKEGQSKLAYVQGQIKKLMPLMHVYDKQGVWNGLYSSDGALLLRFLAQKGVER